jgi:hypothetical protein
MLQFAVCMDTSHRWHKDKVDVGEDFRKYSNGECWIVGCRYI